MTTAAFLCEMQMRAILRANELRRIQDRRGGATAAPNSGAQ
jgi:hypothetical protein